VTSIVATIALAIVWALPLSWWVTIAGAALFAAFASAAIARRVWALGCVSLVGAISVGYAALALTDRAAAGAFSRLGYPFLVATGLRLPGGAVLLALCALVSVIPLLFRDEDRAAARARTG